MTSFFLRRCLLFPHFFQAYSGLSYMGILGVLDIEVLGLSMIPDEHDLADVYLVFIAFLPLTSLNHNAPQLHFMEPFLHSSSHWSH